MHYQIKMDINLAQQPLEEFKHMAFYHCFFDLPMDKDDISFNIHRLTPAVLGYFYKILLYDIYIIYFK